MANKNTGYIMESRQEIRRLEMKTGFEALKGQALWAGLEPGMRVADIGCGSGKTSSFLKELAGDGEVIGIDRSAERIDFARENYQAQGLSFEQLDLFESLEGLGGFDFIWVRFLLEYHGSRMSELTEKLKTLLNPGGILCLVDLDHNSINHHGHSDRLDRTIRGCAAALEKHSDFDPYAGRKLYTTLYDQGFKEMDVKMEAHHLIFGELTGADEFNWLTKVGVAGRDCQYDFSEYPGGFDEFMDECRSFFTDPRRFTYTPLICCRGVKS